MKSMYNRSADAAELRQRAEEIARDKAAQSPENIAAISLDETRRLLQELRVNQVELELQNEELRRAQLELQTSQAQYYDLYDLAPVGYVTLSEQGLILQANLAAAALLGVPRNQLVQQFLSRFIVPEDVDTYYVCLKQLLATDAPQAYDLRMVKADGAAGSTFDVEISAQYLSSEDGRFVVLLRDNTENKRAERMRRESDDRFRMMADCAPVLIWISDEQKLCTYFNRPWLEFTGRTMAQELGNGWVEGVHPDDLPHCLETYVAAFDARKPFAMEYRLRRRDGEFRWILDNGVPRFGSDGSFAGYIGSCVDIMEQKHAGEAQQRFVQLFRNSPVLMALSSLPEQRFTDVNKVFLRTLGYAKEDLLGKTAAELALFIHPEQQAAVAERLLTRERASDLEVQVRRKDGSILDGLFSGEIVHSQGQQYFLSVMVDISERKQAEQDLREVNCQLAAALAHAEELAVQAQAANVAKSRFLAAMSHEIRTPLNAVLGFSQLLQRDPKLALDHQQWVATINRSGSHLLALLDEILELSKIQAGQQTLVSSAFDLPALLRDLVTMFRLQVDAKQLTLRLDGLDEVQQYLVADAGKLRQILINLLSNAVKFTATGGVWVRASTAPLENLAGLTVGWRLVVLVGDSGPGIGVEDFGRLFAAFEQATAGRHSCSGTGLGLAIGRQLARLMGGDLTVTSELGQGSVFRMEVHAQPATASMLTTKLGGSQVQSGLDDVHVPAFQSDGTTAAGSPALIRARLDSLPAVLRKQLHEAAVRGRQGQLRQMLQQVADPELRQQLLNLVAKFDYQPFLELLS